jgi:hypothetical protein
MKTIIGVFVLALLGSAHAYAHDAFEKVRCDGDIVKALIGQRDFDEPTIVTENRHRDIGLKELGAWEDNGFSSFSWSICGKQFVVLYIDRTRVPHDVLEIPPHSESTPAFEGLCKLNGKLMSESVVAILTDESGKDELPAETAWRVDEKTVKFVKQPTGGLLCPRDGVIKAQSR